LCLGILYHLPASAVFRLVGALHAICTRLLIVETHVSLFATRRYSYQGRQYAGRLFVEHAPEATPAEKERRVWASLDNPTSFWLTRPSLYNLLAAAEFTSVFACVVPIVPALVQDRLTVAAIKGQAVPLPGRQPRAVLPELSWSRNRWHHLRHLLTTGKFAQFPARIRRLVPTPLRARLKALLR
jgi:hypothetical protein